MNEILTFPSKEEIEREVQPEHFKHSGLYPYYMPIFSVIFRRRLKTIHRCLRSLGVDPSKVRALDVGCGFGMLFLAYSRSFGNSELIGVDVSDVAVNYALEIARSRAFVHQFVNADAIFLPFKSGYFDLVFALDVLEHLEDPQKVLMEMARCLKEDGVMIVTVPLESPMLQAVRYFALLGGRLGNVRPHWKGEMKNYKEFLKFVESRFYVTTALYTPVNLFKGYLNYGVCLIFRKTCQLTNISKNFRL